MQLGIDILDKYFVRYLYRKEVAISKGGDFPTNVANQVTAWFVEESGGGDVSGSEAR